MNIHSKPKTLDSLMFDNRFTSELPADPETANYRRQVRRVCFTLAYNQRKRLSHG
jgi:hypothetical protein